MKPVKFFFILSISLIFLTTNAVKAQDDFDKKFRFGLKAAPSLNWYKPDNVKKFTSNGTSLKFGFGLMTEFRLSNTVYFTTGLELNYDGGKLNFLDSTYYALDKDKAFIEIKKEGDYIVPANSADTSGLGYQLKNRKYNVTYVNIPLMFKMRTNEIGYIRYYGQFGVNAGIKTKARVDDETYLAAVANSPIVQEEDLDLDKDMNLFRFQLHIGLGGEYSLSGSTAFVFGLGYNLGFSNVIRKESRYLYNVETVNNNFIAEITKQNATAHNIVLNLGILF